MPPAATDPERTPVVIASGQALERLDQPGVGAEVDAATRGADGVPGGDLPQARLGAAPAGRQGAAVQGGSGHEAEEGGLGLALGCRRDGATI